MLGLNSLEGIEFLYDVGSFKDKIGFSFSGVFILVIFYSGAT